MAEYGEWTQKGATLSDATAKAEYGVDYAFIVKGIKAGKFRVPRRSCIRKSLSQSPPKPVGKVHSQGA